ncbi:MAG: alpha/beta hydrolase [Methanoregula sp.]|nr:alpha/beta hydrolase [Methanoregula sp.]
MNRKHFLILTIAITICLLAAAGCTGTSGSAQPADTCQVVTQLPSVSFNVTPVQYATVNGVKLGYREFGSGEPLLMVMGFDGNIDGWNETFIGILASKYHVYTYDHRGMGYSSDYNTTPSILQFADDAAALMPVLGYDSMHVYGVSMGSSVSQQLVIDHPERVRKLILSSSSYSVQIPETEKLLGDVKSTAIDPTAPVGEREEAKAILAWNGTWSGLAGINKDVMLIVGTADDLTPDSVSVQMAGQINGSWLVRFKGIPHAGSMYAPVEYGQSVVTFLGMDESPAITG